MFKLLSIVFLFCVYSPATWSTQCVFFGNICAKNCKGHKAGYEFAEESNLKSKSYCKHDSASFESGCKAYLSDKSISHAFKPSEEALRSLLVNVNRELSNAKGFRRICFQQSVDTLNSALDYLEEGDLTRAYMSYSIGSGWRIKPIYKMENFKSINVLTGEAK